MGLSSLLSKDEGLASVIKAKINTQIKNGGNSSESDNSKNQHLISLKLQLMRKFQVLNQNLRKDKRAYQFRI